MPLTAYAGSIVLAGANPGQFAILPGSSCISVYGVIVAAGASCAVDVQFVTIGAVAGKHYAANLLFNINASPSPGVTLKGVLSAGLQPYYIHSDHLDTPRMITDTAGAVVWQWDNVDPFGNNMADENPTGAGAFSFNLRFPGQYFDKETNTHYNINRDYDPATGRYIQSDPIGLAGGINTYGYVNSNPLSYADPLGLEAEMCYRPIQGYIIPGQHCFVRFNGDDNNTLSFTFNGVGQDASPRKATCEKAKGRDDDDCVKREMKKCQNYGFFKNNCCHCVEQVLKACGQSVPLKKWPNYPINPGPQPSEPGYKP
ncbi:MAG: hypothetical protein PHP85_13495 [Gallionella sp.]|nr:hypothetical protein [Gallionella sp.]